MGCVFYITHKLINTFFVKSLLKTGMFDNKRVVKKSQYDRKKEMINELY